MKTCQEELIKELINILKYGERIDYLLFWRRVTSKYGHMVLKEVQSKAQSIIDSKVVQ